VHIWVLSRIRFVSYIQATYRGYLWRRILQTRIAWESYNATIIQRIARGVLNRKRVLRLRKNIAALHIQCNWRGYISRKGSNWLWLASKAIKIQKFMRGYLAKKYVQVLSTRYKFAATLIQKIFRGIMVYAICNFYCRKRKRNCLYCVGTCKSR